MTKPLCVDMYAGLGGWAEGFIAEGYDVVGFDIERHVYGDHCYPAQLVLQDVLTVDGSQFRDAAVIVCSPPCQKYSYMAMPWTRAKQLAAWYRESPVRIAELNALFDACFRIQLEASKAAGRYIPLIIENVKGAQPWVGRAKWHYGSYYLWGDVPALMPTTKSIKAAWDNSIRGKVRRVDEVKIGGAAGDDWFAHHNRAEFLERAGVKVSGHTLNKVPGKQSVGFNVMAVRQMREQNGHKAQGKWFGPYSDRARDTVSRTGSKTDARKQASAMIAKIPFPLASYIARVFKP